MPARVVVVVVGDVVVLAALVVFGWVLGRPDFTVPPGVLGVPPGWSDLLAPTCWAATGTALLWVRPRNAVGALLLFCGVCLAVADVASAYGMYGVGVADPQWPLARWVAFLGQPLWVPGFLPLLSVLLALYPEGHLPGPRWRLPAASAAVGVALLTLAVSGGYHDVAPGAPPVDVELSGVVLWLFASAIILTLLGGTVAIWVMSVLRLLRAPAPLRQQLAWLLFGVVPLLVLGLLTRWQAVSVGVPVAIAVGVFRYRMLGIEVALRRGLVYAVLTGLVVAVYLAATQLLGALVPDEPVPGILAAGLVAVGLSPVRERVQRGVDRLLYGDRRDPMRAVTRMSDTVAAAGDPADLLPSVLSTVAAALQAPGAAVMSPDGKPVTVVGVQAEGLRCGLRVHGREVGALRVTDRSPGQRYGEQDRRLLVALAAQVAVVVRAVDLAEALEVERDRVVSATRAERDRLRRDLHDGLGPSLSGIGLGLQALDSALDRGDGRTAGEMLHRVRTEASTAVVEVRRILEDLRPAPLDDRGLAGALRRHVAVAAGGVQVDLCLPAALPPLAARLETAALRIAQEALTNVVRHARATTARLAVSSGDGLLRIEVSDDGAGFPALGTHGGVGLSSMRHRAEVLGGRLDVSTGTTGTSVVATLPLGDVP